MIRIEDVSIQRKRSIRRQERSSAKHTDPKIRQCLCIGIREADTNRKCQPKDFFHISSPAIRKHPVGVCI
jgi:hypothetical protein